MDEPKIKFDLSPTLSLKEGRDTGDCSPAPHINNKRNYRAYGTILSEYFCKCTICTFQIYKAKNKKTNHINYKDIEAKKQGKLKSYTWLLSELGRLGSSMNVKITIPDTVVFRKGKPWFILQNFRDKHIRITQNPDRLNLAKILKSFIKIVKKRKKEEITKLNNDNDSTVFITQESFGKEMSLLKYLVKGKDCSEIEENPQFEDGVLRVMSEKEFIDFMYERPGSAV